MKNKMNKKGSLEIVGLILLIVVISIFFIYNIAYAFTSGNETITIKEKWVKYKNQDAKYLVSSTDDQVFQITDTWVRWRFDSSNLYAKLEVNNTYHIKTQGWRFPLLSDYKNILEADCNEK